MNKQKKGLIFTPPPVTPRAFPPEADAPWAQARVVGFTLLNVVILLSFCFAQDLKKEDIPVIVNGDKVEFFAELEKVVAEGNVEVEYEALNLTCDRIVVFTKTKDAFAEGNVRLVDEKSVIRGKSLFYNFDTQRGKIVDADFDIPPYFGVSPEAEKFPDKFILHDADLTTCNLDSPHYHFHCKSVEIVPDDELRAKKITFFTGEAPIVHLPFFVQDISEKRNGLSLSPGQSKVWGDYLLTAYRYHFTDNFRGLFRADYRANKGLASGLDFELFSDNFGDSSIVWYYIKEDLHGRGEEEPFFKNDERYKFEYRHNWDIDDQTKLVMELNDYSDVNLLKHYFYRQYEKKAQPNSYILFTHSYPEATFSLQLSKRMNQFYSETEKVPEIKFETTKFNITDIFKSKAVELEAEGLETDKIKADVSEGDVTETQIVKTDLSEKFSIYYQNQSDISGLTTRTALTDEDTDAVYADTYNQLSFPSKISIFNVEPYVGVRYTYFSKDKNGSENLFRSVFYSGHSILTKFYRIFNNVKINSYGLEIDKLRHIITPSVSYGYIHDPSLPADRLSFNGISKSNSGTLSLENKLQTKRNEESVDFLTLIISNSYSFKLEEHGGRFGNLKFDLEILPNSWLKYESDASFDLKRNSFSTANFDVEFPLGEKGKEKGKVTAGYQYAAGGDDSEILTFGFERQLNPKWKLRTYHRINFVARKSIEEQEYALSRDLHCWEVEFIVNSRKKKGATFWVAFRCKAFPDLGFDFSKHHQAPKHPVP